MILVIDDNAASADAIARTLRETGREVHLASTVPDALAALAADTPLVVVAASGGSPVLRPCVEGITTPDVDLTLTGLGAGGVVLPNARPLVDTVANITALTRPAGTMGFATDASGGAKPCWSTGSGWILASGSALT